MYDGITPAGRPYIPLTPEPQEQEEEREETPDQEKVSEEPIREEHQVDKEA